MDSTTALQPSSVLPWDSAPELAWRVLTSPMQQWDVMPSFVLGELLFIAVALVALWHARRSGSIYLLCWFGALLAGTANDVFFMALPLVDNFWQAQAMIMLTPRLPLYIPCVYVCFMYLPTVAVWRLDLSPPARATLSGLAAILFYAPYDIAGAKYLWWTWHDSDPLIGSRLLGAPIGSTVWVITFAATFAYLIGRVRDRDQALRGRAWFKALATIIVLAIPLMTIQMTALQQLDGGLPGRWTLLAVLLLYGATAIVGLRQRQRGTFQRVDRPLLVAVTVHFITFLLIVTVFDPAAHRSASVHQTYGPCGVKTTDFMGIERDRYICADAYRGDFRFDCGAARPEDGANWYTVCGRPHQDRPAWMGVVGALGVTGLLLFGYALGPWRRREEGDAASPSAPDPESEAG